MKSNRFLMLTPDEIKEKERGAKNKHSKSAEERAARAFVSFIKQSEEEVDLDFTKFNDAELDAWLARFWHGARTREEKSYRCSSLNNIRFSLNRHLQDKCDRDIDIIHGAAFKNSTSKFNTAMELLKDEGQGFVKHYDEITQDGK
jgi:hypothetical protein